MECDTALSLVPTVSFQGILLIQKATEAGYMVLTPERGVVVALGTATTLEPSWKWLECDSLSVYPQKDLYDRLTKVRNGLILLQLEI